MQGKGRGWPSHSAPGCGELVDGAPGVACSQPSVRDVTSRLLTLPIEERCSTRSAWRATLTSSASAVQVAAAPGAPVSSSATLGTRHEPRQPPPRTQAPAGGPGCELRAHHRTAGASPGTRRVRGGALLREPLVAGTRRAQVAQRGPSRAAPGRAAPPAPVLRRDGGPVAPPAREGPGLARRPCRSGLGAPVGARGRGATGSPGPAASPSPQQVRGRVEPDRLALRPLPERDSRLLQEPRGARRPSRASCPRCTPGPMWRSWWAWTTPSWTR